MFLISEISVDVNAIEDLGIKCIQVPGSVAEGKPVYDDETLRQILESTVTP
jgi:hypothetical protein